MDLAAGHVCALNHMFTDSFKGTNVFNLGSGNGISVKELLAALEKACGKALPSKVVARRDGDLASVWADPRKAEKTLGWKAVKTADQMCTDAWKWQSNNPNGFE